jgi:anti-sigma factor RsiW
MSATRMTCREFVEFLMDYVSQELPDDTRTVFESHITACPDCVQYLVSYRQTIVLCRDAFHVSDDEVPAEVPEDLVQAILAAQRKMGDLA